VADLSARQRPVALARRDEFTPRTFPARAHVRATS